MKKVLFLIHDLGPGGAEKVLVNLVNNMNKDEFDITVHALFDGGINRQFLAPHIHYTYSFSKMYRGNSKVMKLFSPEFLHKWLIKEHYDIEVAYLEGPSTRIISGCSDSTTKLIAWVHTEFDTMKQAVSSFRSESEAEKSYDCFQKIICVSEMVKKKFYQLFKTKSDPIVYYNTNESEKIIHMSNEEVQECVFCEETIKLVCVGKLIPVKGFARALKIVNRLIREGYPIRLYILGVGPEETTLKRYIESNNMNEYIKLLGYQTNPYKFVAKCDLFVCTSYREGFSTAATEALIVGTPVCTVEVSGMKELLGENNEYGVVTQNNDDALYEGIKELVSNSDLLKHYKNQAIVRGKDFRKSKTVHAVEEMLESLC